MGSDLFFLPLPGSFSFCSLHIDLAGNSFCATGCLGGSQLKHHIPVLIARTHIPHKRRYSASGAGAGASARVSNPSASFTVFFPTSYLGLFARTPGPCLEDGVKERRVCCRYCCLRQHDIRAWYYDHNGLSAHHPSLSPHHRSPKKHYEY